MKKSLENSHGKIPFKFDEENIKVVETICQYLNREESELNKQDFTVNKGIWLKGNFGSGKTLIMECYKEFKEKYLGASIGFKTCRDINDEFMKFDKDTKKINGIDAIRVYGNKNDKFEKIFDDLGEEETTVQDYGNKFSPMAYVLSERHKGFRNGTITHVTTNLSNSEIESIYGGRIASRIHESYNHIILGKGLQSIDYRKLKA